MKRVPTAEKIRRLKASIIEHTKGDELFWLGEILLMELERASFHVNTQKSE